MQNEFMLRLFVASYINVLIVICMSDFMVPIPVEYLSLTDVSLCVML